MSYFQKLSSYINYYFYCREEERIQKERGDGCFCGLKDDRMDFYELKNLFVEFTDRRNLKKSTGKTIKTWERYFSRMERNIRSVVMVVPKELMREDKSDASMMIIDSVPLKQRRISDRKLRICEDSFYLNQASVHPVGSGFFIKKDMIATAAHLLIGPKKNLSDFRFVRGILMENKNSFKRKIVVPKSNVFEARESFIPYSNYEYDFYSDWLILGVRPSYPAYFSKQQEKFSVIYTERDPSLIRRNGKREKVYAVGHGLGLPMKISFGGDIIKCSKSKRNFECNLTLVPGNSGSPVFYADTHELAGIYMRGINKWVLDCENDCVKIRNHRFLYEGQECQMLEPIRKNLQA